MPDKVLALAAVAASAWLAWRARGWYERWRRWWRPRVVRWRWRPGQLPPSFPHLSPDEFEELVATLFRAWGWQATVTGGAGDRGIDVRLWRDGEYVVVQCKRYRGLVPPNDVRAFYGVVVRENASRGFFVTTGRFSEATRREAEQFRPPVLLIDGQELYHYLTMNRLPLP